MDGSITVSPYLDQLLADRVVEIAKRSLPSAIAFAAMGLMLVFGTEISVSAGLGLWLVAFVLFVCSGLRVLVSILGGRMPSPVARHPQSVLGLYLLTSTAWGVLAAIVIARYGVGWATFLTLVMTMGLAAVCVAELVPVFPVLIANTFLILGPVALTTAVFLNGIHSWAVEGVLLGTAMLLMLQGRLLHREFTTGITAEARFRAMIDALPGTLSWVDANGNYLGVNKQLAAHWGKQPREFVGQTIGFSDANSPLVGFTHDLFAKEWPIQKHWAQLKMAGESRQYYFVGHKYNYGKEAVILGMDMSDLPMGRS